MKTLELFTICRYNKDDSNFVKAILIETVEHRLYHYSAIAIIDLAFLTDVTKNPLGIYIYRIDIETIEQYVSEHLKEKLRQLTLFDLRLRQEEEVKAEKV